jgi:aminomethyltransferase
MPERTILYDLQRAANAKLIDFHGWEMAVQFSSITQEHHAVRTAAGAFDLCHMGRLRLSGSGSGAFLSRHVSRPSADMAPGQVRYGMVLAEDGTIEDDVLVSRESETSWHVVVNASNKEKILSLWAPDLGAQVQCQDLSRSQAMIAIQGPRALDILASMGMDARGAKYYSFLDVSWNGMPVRLSRTGYTGEDGCECFVATEHAGALWQAVLAAGITPCGLGARDTLRLEAGMPLYGNELDRTTTPIEAGLNFAVGKKGGYIGAARILEQLEQGPQKKLIGLRMLEKRVPRSHYPVCADGKTIGQITSGTLSPTFGYALGMAYVPTSFAQVGGTLQVDLRGQMVAAEVVALPWYRRAR